VDPATNPFLSKIIKSSAKARAGFPVGQSGTNYEGSIGAGVV